jgi:glycosyltransferase involved in cell wall biosynthesis
VNIILEAAAAMPTAPPLVSVVVPCFNRASLIEGALRSVLDQSFTDWELIVVDDASRDNLAATLRAYTADPRIRCICHPVNRGVSAARNTGVAAARGRFVAFLDSDDAWLPGKLAQQVAAVMAAPEPDRVFCVTRTRVVMPGGWERLRPTQGPASGSSFAEFLYNEGGFVQCSSFFLSGVMARAVPFRENLRQYEDHLFFAEVGARGASYLLVPDALTVWRNDDRADRLGGHDDLVRAELFIETAATALPRRAMQAFRARAMFHLVWRRSRREATGLLLSAWRDGALSLRQGATLLLRHVVPASVYESVRRLAGRAERVTGRP